MRKRLSPAATGLGLLLAIASVHQGLMVPAAAARPLVTLTAVSAAIFFLIRWLTAYASPTLRRIHPLATCMAGLVLANALARLQVTPDPRQTIDLMLLLIAAGWFFLSTRWLLLLIVATWCGWLLVGPLRERLPWNAELPPAVDPSSAWWLYGIGLSFATLLSLLIRWNQAGQIRDSLRLRQYQESPADRAAGPAGEMQEREERYRRLSDASIEGVAMHEYGKILDTNLALATMLGYPVAGLAGKNILDLVTPESRRQISATLFLGNFKSTEAVARRKDGSTLPVELFSKSVAFRNRTVMVTALRDITGRKHIEEVIALEKQRLAQQYRQQAALAGMNVAIDKPDELAAVFSRIAEVATEILPAGGGACIILADEKTGGWKIASILEPQRIPQPVIEKLAAPGGATEWITRNRQSLIVSDMAYDPFAAEQQFIEQGIKAYAGFPLLDEGTVFGVLYAFDMHPRTYHHADLNFLSALASRAAVAIVKVRLFEQMRNANNQLDSQRAELQLKNMDLAEAKEFAERASRAKSQFLDTISHELRTPMNGVLGMTGLLLSTELSAEQRDYVETAQRSAEALLKSINEILDFAKIETGQFRREARAFDPRQLVEATVKFFLPVAQEKQLALSAGVAPEIPPTLQGDAPRIQQVLHHLVANAIKFTRQGNVSLRVTRDQETDNEWQLRFEVQDTGIGIAPEIRPRLFLPFSQADGSASRNFGGLGLGLAMAKQLVTLMQGHIGVDSEAGQGSTFWFVLGLKKSPAAPAAP